MDFATTNLFSRVSSKTMERQFANDTGIDTSLQALIFDMDGVLTDTLPYHLKAWLQYSTTVPELDAARREQLEQKMERLINCWRK